jgi:D-alanyl-D-alanine carboxypeptidase/D-alanyl-D-alanine-endopeptidase (penicillin-binding protein 4)
MRLLGTLAFTGLLFSGALIAEPIPQNMQKIMDLKKYAHAFWALYVKDLETGKIYYDLNSEKMFSPASTTKLFSTSALLHAYGDDYRFTTPIVATADIKNGELKGNLVLIGQGDLTFGGRQPNPDTIEFTKMDHIIANVAPGVTITKEDPLQALNEMAKQLYQKGLRKITGDVVIDDSLFETIEKRDFVLSPIMINENLIDIIINPGTLGQPGNVTWRPEVPGYTVENQTQTVAKGEPAAIEISSDESGQKIVVKGTVPYDSKDLIRTSSIKNPKEFAKAALIQALKSQGIVLNQVPAAKAHASYKTLKPLVEWVSPPLTEYVKLILKVSHNIGADLIPLLLASEKGQTTFDEGMLTIGDFLIHEVKLSPDAFVMTDGAGGNENRFTPQAELQMLEYMHSKKPESFRLFFNALPILGVDGSLEDFAKKTGGAGKVHAKPGTGVVSNFATGKLFLITQALAGYFEGKNGHMFAYMLAVNNGQLPTIDDIFAIFEDQGQLSSLIYEEITK